MADIIRKEGIKPVRVLITGYIVLIAIGTILLSLPISHNGMFSFIDAVFTSASAVCVTGLIVKDTPVFFTPFGKAVLLLLIQIGGIGYMSIITLFAVLIGRKITFQEELMIKTSYNHVSMDDIGKFALSVLKWTVIVEILGAIILFSRFYLIYKFDLFHSFSKSIFHSVSSFCNAGFSLFSTSMKEYYNDPIIVGTISLLIILGGLGFFVLRDIYSSILKKHRITVHSKIVLSTTLLLIVTGIIAILAMENNSSLINLSLTDKVFISFFQSVTARTAGFNTISISLLTNGTLFFIIILMFIGASPGGTGGGIKTTTFSVLITGLRKLVSKDDRVDLFKRNLSINSINRAFFIFTISLMFVVISLLLLLATQNLQGNALNIVFEEISAFGTVGLSAGSKTIANTSLSADFNSFGKLIIVITMLFGKIGPFSVALALVEKGKKSKIQYPPLEIIIG
jgi:trk system potassium uptake protein TrkH